MHDLTFDTLRAANLARIPTFKSAKGELCHPPKEGVPTGHDWDASKWSNATMGELGELANLVKKLERPDFALDDLTTDPKTGETLTYRELMGKELADVVIYADLLGNRLGIDLGAMIVKKFNEVSRRVDSPIFLAEPGPYDDDILPIQVHDVRADGEWRGRVIP